MSTSKRSILAKHASEMRAAPTWGELVLWQVLKGSQLGVGFRRQVVIGGRIVDFCAPSLRLVVEVDGGYHAGRAGSDARKDRELRRLGWRVVRVSDEAVRCRLGDAVAVILAAIEEGRAAR